MMITVDSGIIIIMRDGTIINFPNGNDDEYRAWCKTDGSRDAVLFFGGKDIVASSIFRSNDADYFVDEARNHFEYDGLDALLENMIDFYDEMIEKDDEMDKQTGETGRQVITRLFKTESKNYLEVLAKHRDFDQKRFEHFQE